MSYIVRFKVPDDLLEDGAVMGSFVDVIDYFSEGRGEIKEEKKEGKKEFLACVEVSAKLHDLFIDELKSFFKIDEKEITSMEKPTE